MMMNPLVGWLEDLADAGSVREPAAAGLVGRATGEGMVKLVGRGN